MATTAQELAALRASVEAWREEDQRDRVEAQRAREAVAKDIEELKADAAHTRNKITVMENDLKDTKDVTDRVKSWRSIAMGAIIMLGLIGTAFTLFKDHLADFLWHVISGSEGR